MPIPPLKKVESELEEVTEKVEETVNHLIHKKKRKPFYQKGIFWLVIVFFAVLLLSGYAYFSYWQPLKNSLILAKQSQYYFERVQNDLLTADFIQAKQDIETAQSLLTRLKKNVNKLDSPLMIGYLRNEYNAVQNIITATQELSDGLYLLTNLAQDILSKVSRDAKSGNLNITPAQRKEILEKFSHKTPELNGAKAQIDLSLITLNQIPISRLNPQLADYVLNLRTKLNLLKIFLDKSIALSQSAPSLLGLNQEKTYLFLLENNNELRPTGGFLGTLGILKVKDGKILSFNTQNVYDYDKFAHGKLHVPPPKPIKKYLNVKGWYLRDSNWSPDFIKAAKKIEWFYHKEAQLSKGALNDYKIDGVIAITPKIVQEFLGIVGAIEIDSFVFTKDNFVDQLQYLVEVGYEEQGVEYFQRKNIIGRLSQKMIARTENMSLKGWLELTKSAFNNLNQKHILIVTKDPIVQDLINKQNWSGAINQTQGDYLFVVDANLAALKSNECVKREIKYTLKPESNKLTAKVDIHYNNQCKFTWKTTRYRTYTRIYVPLGSKWIKTTGSMDMDRSPKPGETDILEESNKTVFGAFISIEPGQTGTLSFEYYLPDYLAQKIFDGEAYNLYLQKQAGTLKDKILLDLRFPEKIKSTYPSEPRSGWGDNHYQLITDLEVDRKVRIGF